MIAPSTAPNRKFALFTVTIRAPSRLGWPTIAAISGVISPLTRVFTTATNAAPMTNATASSITFPRMMKFLNPASIGCSPSRLVACNCRVLCVRGFGSGCFGEDGVGVFDPVEGFAALVPGVDVGADRGREVGDGGERSAADGLAGQDVEGDQVHPGPGRRGEVHRDPRVLG